LRIYHPIHMTGQFFLVHLGKVRHYQLGLGI
jgi:hypothetical protein